MAKAWDHAELERLARRAYEEAKEKTVQAEAKLELAMQIAKAPPPGEGAPRLTYEQEEKLRGLILRTDSKDRQLRRRLRCGRGRARGADSRPESSSVNHGRLGRSARGRRRGGAPLQGGAGPKVGPC